MVHYRPPNMLCLVYAEAEPVFHCICIYREYEFTTCKYSYRPYTSR